MTSFSQNKPYTFLAVLDNLMDQRSIPKEGAKDVTFPRFRVIPKDTPKKEGLRQFPWALEAVW